jgi:hypothetical protein
MEDRRVLSSRFSVNAQLLQAQREAQRIQRRAIQQFKDIIAGRVVDAQDTARVTGNFFPKYTVVTVEGYYPFLSPASKDEIISFYNKTEFESPIGLVYMNEYSGTWDYLNSYHDWGMNTPIGVAVMGPPGQAPQQDTLEEEEIAQRIVQDTSQTA